MMSDPSSSVSLLKLAGLVSSHRRVLTQLGTSVDLAAVVIGPSCSFRRRTASRD